MGVVLISFFSFICLLFAQMNRRYVAHSQESHQMERTTYKFHSRFFVRTQCDAFSRNEKHVFLHYLLRSTYGHLKKRKSSYFLLMASSIWVKQGRIFLIVIIWHLHLPIFPLVLTSNSCSVSRAI